MADDDSFGSLTDADLQTAGITGTPSGGSDSLNVGQNIQGLSDQDLVDAGIVAAPSGGNIGGLLGTLAAGGGLAYSAFAPSAEQSQLTQLQQAATGAGTTATALEAPLTSGVLPQGAQAALNQSQASQIAKQRSAYASMGMAGSTGEADAVSAVNQNIAAQKYSIEANMFDQAGKFAQLQGTELEGLLKYQMAKDQNFSNALTNFTSSLAKTSATDLASVGQDISGAASWIGGLFS